MEKLEDKIRAYIIRYMDPSRFGGRVILIHGNDTREFPDISKARAVAFSMPGISIIIAVPRKEEADEAFIRFIMLNKET
ncbi:hypothetical protein [Vulcanisaeta distributa]|uniref:hypothetical protein n=1 Tax=Vulcanisaeta distributa TaxID=164451 RepID=UPI0006D09F16|nr:hypothetical protein [Vulcanisaeta distributa]